MGWLPEFSLDPYIVDLVFGYVWAGEIYVAFWKLFVKSSPNIKIVAGT